MRRRAASPLWQPHLDCLIFPRPGAIREVLDPPGIAHPLQLLPEAARHGVVAGGVEADRRLRSHLARRSHIDLIGGKPNLGRQAAGRRRPVVRPGCWMQHHEDPAARRRALLRGIGRRLGVGQWTGWWRHLLIRRRPHGCDGNRRCRHCLRRLGLRRRGLNWSRLMPQVCRHLIPGGALGRGSEIFQDRPTDGGDGQDGEPEQEQRLPSRDEPALEQAHGVGRHERIPVSDTVPPSVAVVLRAVTKDSA